METESFSPSYHVHFRSSICFHTLCNSITIFLPPLYIFLLLLSFFLAKKKYNLVLSSMKEERKQEKESEGERKMKKGKKEERDEELQKREKNEKIHSSFLLSSFLSFFLFILSHYVRLHLIFLEYFFLLLDMSLVSEDKSSTLFSLSLSLVSREDETERESDFSFFFHPLLHQKEYEKDDIFLSIFFNFRSNLANIHCQPNFHFSSLSLSSPCISSFSLLLHFFSCSNSWERKNVAWEELWEGNLWRQRERERESSERIKKEKERREKCH